MLEIEQKYRTVIFYKDYFEKFFLKQSNKVRDKIIWTLNLIEELPVVPETYMKYIKNTEGLYEIRVQKGSDIFRIFCFFDKEKLVIIINGYQKKTQKTLNKEIERALRVKKEYENERKLYIDA